MHQARYIHTRGIVYKTLTVNLRRCIQEQLDEIQRHKAIWVYRWARTSGMKTSRDEIAEMVLQNCLTPDLEQLWEQGRAKQKLVIQLCDTIVDSSLDNLKVLPCSDATKMYILFSQCPPHALPFLAMGGYLSVDHPPRRVKRHLFILTQELLGAGDNPYRDVLREGICDLLTMRAPLHCAARLGKVPQLELLLEAGSPVDCPDGHGWTALQVLSQNHVPHKMHACLAHVCQLMRTNPPIILP